MREVEGSRIKNVASQYFLGVVEPTAIWDPAAEDLTLEDIHNKAQLFKLKDLWSHGRRVAKVFGQDLRFSLKDIFGEDKVKLDDHVDGWADLYEVQLSYIRKFDMDDNLSKLCFKNIKQI